MTKEVDVAKFIADKVAASIGSDCIMGSSVIVFEFIGGDGRLGHGVLRQKNTDMEETIDILVAATQTLLEANDQKFPYDEDYPDNI